MRDMANCEGVREMEREICGWSVDGVSFCECMAEWAVMRDASPDGLTQACSEHLHMGLGVTQENRVWWIGDAKADKKETASPLDLGSIAKQSFAEVGAIALLMLLMVALFNWR